ncbi:HERV-H LTR-associating protein 2 [Cricetulus griseus]|uniref:HERV-H LTR-associating protein 2 n=1 Tax=Cricetulus griseus TaxID=10029 RepID=A0A9J7H0A9_CRIGR|nr:HERV-H LTR-associating protein 2 [Cricetulus griseus]
MLDLFFPVPSSYLQSNNEQLVTGRYNEDVILPCQFTSGDEVVIHWKNQNHDVHSYYGGMDRLKSQYLRYANRTSLFHGEIHNGNASLTIRRLSLLDEGIYSCYVGTKLGRTLQRVVLKVGAFHSPLMKYEQMNMESFLECSIQSVYPHPHITWKMDNTDVSEESNSKITGIPGPFHIKSMLNITGSNSSFECTIENSLLSQTWRGKWTFSGSHWMNQSESILLWCTVSSNFSLQNQNFNVTWSRIQNGIYSVLDWHLDSSQYTATNDSGFSWNKALRDHSDFPITLKHLHASDSGEYLCNISSTEYTLLTVHRLIVGLAVVVWAPGYTIKRDRPLKSVKPEASFIPEKEEKITTGHKKAYQLTGIIVRDRASETVIMGAGLGPLQDCQQQHCAPKSTSSLHPDTKKALSFLGVQINLMSYAYVSCNVFLGFGAFLTGVPEHENLSAEDLGLLLRGLQQRLGLLLLLLPGSQGLFRVLQLLLQGRYHRAGLAQVRKGIPQLHLEPVPGPLQGGVPGFGHLHCFCTLLQSNRQLLPDERSRTHRGHQAFA